MVDIDTVHHRLAQSMACVDAILVDLVNRETDPGGSHLTDHVLQGLAFAAGELLRQAKEAAK